jgi:hypothetical protein
LDGDVGDVLTNDTVGAVLSIRTEDVNLVVPDPGAVNVRTALLPTESLMVPELSDNADVDA